MGGGGGQPHEVPDWKIYKAEGIPELDHLQRRLAALGLKDPWIRNEAWRFSQANGGTVPWYRVGMKSMFRGFGFAVVALGLTILYKNATGNGKDDHGHH